jgi:glycosyltransferase involved in cell wall biosynthesis
MRVALVSEHASPLAAVGGVDAGGQNVYVSELATNLGDEGVDVVVHTRRDDPSLPRRVEIAPGVIVDHVDAGPAKRVPKDELLTYMDAFADDLSRCWSADPPDVIHSHFWMSGRAALAAAPPGVPVVHTFHALGMVKRRYQGVRDPSPRGRLAEERRIVRCADLVIATCSDEVVELARIGADLRRVTVVPCGVDLERFHPKAPAEPRPEGLHRIATIGRLVERKGVDDVITALADLPGAELVIAGGPPLAELHHDPEVRRLRATALRAGVADRVIFRGSLPRDAVPPLLRSADIVVCSPWYEPFGMVPLEARACGVPVVATAVGGMLDTVVDGVTGLHVPPRRPDVLAHALASLLADPERRDCLGVAGRRCAEQRYGWDRVADATLASYSRLLRAAPLADAEAGAGAA